MSDIFKSYESDFELAYQEAHSKLGQITSLNDAQRKSALKSVEIATEECLELIDQMNIEVQSLPSSQRSSYNTKIRQYKAKVDEAKTKLKQLLDDEDKRELFGSRYKDSDEFDSEGGSLHDSQRKQLLNNNSSIERSNQRLRDSQRIALETENIGGNILNDLRSQRETITNSRNTLDQADNYVDKSIKTLKTMTRRMTANKFISYAIIAVLIILIFLVLASKFW
ncbi:t-SNARE Vti1p [[Candida] railenensis]|uniref:t-SNARE Vti1p n=1 Tax=[Candida] railenensis TaxID=45579 RepID=A0A9P0VZV6_9ASCO|nr:t-SNARE Vti1p [[Candida] railenensis]